VTKLGTRDWVVIVVNAVLIGIAWGDMRAQTNQARADIAQLRHIVGDGNPSVFMRTDIAKGLIERATERNAAILTRLDRIEAKLDRITHRGGE